MRKILTTALFASALLINAQKPKTTIRSGKANATAATTQTTSATTTKVNAAAPMTKSKGAYVVNTTTICKDKGFADITPLLITIKNDVIQTVEALPNKETPNFFEAVVSQMLPKYYGMKISDVEKVDIATGATYSSKAVKANVKAACDYYKKNK